MNRFIALASAMVLAVCLVGNLAFAKQSGHSAVQHQYGKQGVCHATGSAKHPYVFLMVPVNSAHFTKHSSDVYGPGINSKDDCSNLAGKAKHGDKGKPDGKGKGKSKSDSKTKSKGKSKSGGKGKGHNK